MKGTLNYKGYYGSVHFDEEALLFYGKVEFIKALVSYEATDAKGLKSAFEEAIDDYLGLCKEQGIEAETPFKGSLNVRLGSDLHRRIAMASARKKMSVNKFISETLDRFTNENSL